MTKKINFHILTLNESSETSHLRLLKHKKLLQKPVLSEQKYLQINIMGTVHKLRRNPTDLVSILTQH